MRIHPLEKVAIWDIVSSAYGCSVVSGNGLSLTSA